jgi:hypothetical protein
MWQQPRRFNPALASHAATMRDTTSGLNGPPYRDEFGRLTDPG